MNLEAVANIFTILGAIASILTFIIAIYLFHIQFSHSLKILSVEPRIATFYGETITITLWNKSISPICISNFQFILSDSFRVSMPLKSKYITIEARKVEVFVLQYSDFNNCFDRTYTPKITSVIINESIYLKYGTKKCLPCSLRLLSICPNIKRLSNNQIIGNDVKYIIILTDKFGNKKTIYMTNTGSLSDLIGDLNLIQDIKDKKSLECFLETNKEDLFLNDIKISISEV